VALGARFYREVSVGPGEGGAYSILLDGKPARTPGAAMLSVPNVELAEAIAEEWRAQGEKIRPQTMMLTKLANTAIDRVAPNRAAVVEQVLVFARSDLICYRAPGPDELAGRQAQIWDPLIAWAREHLSAPLLCTAGVGHVPQTPDALAALEKAIAANGDFRLAGLHAAATLTGSAVIALALSAGRLSFEEAFAAAELDEIYQRGKWGEDAEALRRSRKKEVELIEIAHFLYFVCGDNNPL